MFCCLPQPLSAKRTPPVKPPAIAAPAAAKAGTDVGQQIQSYLDSLAADNKLSGAVLVAKDGATIASKAFGIANQATDTPITLETKFNIGSMNKMFTGIAITQLAQQGKLDFNDTISKHLPDYPNKDVAGKVTIHQLLTTPPGWAPMQTTSFARLSSPQQHNKTEAPAGEQRHPECDRPGCGTGPGRDLRTTAGWRSRVQKAGRDQPKTESD